MILFYNMLYVTICFAGKEVKDSRRESETLKKYEE